MKQSLDEYPITLVTGARQVGKTTLVSIIEKENHYQYLTFDDTDLLALAKKDPKKFVEEHPAPIIIDEVQKAKDLFPKIEAVVNRTKREKGSQAANGMYILIGTLSDNVKAT